MCLLGPVLVYLPGTLAIVRPHCGKAMESFTNFCLVVRAGLLETMGNA